MVYPVFEYNSIATRCQEDIAGFIKETVEEAKKKGKNIVLRDETGLRLSQVATKDQMTAQMAPILAFLQSHLGNETYVKKISKMEPLTQYQLWIARTYLFYQLLIYATTTFLDKTLYDAVYTDRTLFPFMPQLTEKTLVDFKMGIFGSMTPTSDIDIGIQYSGTEKIQALAHIVSRFECLFYLFTGTSSLSYDIETYADMMTLPHTDGDYFYLDSSEFGKEEFERMLPCAGASIVRNLVLAKDVPFDGNFDTIVEDAAFNEKLSYDISFAFPKEALALLQTPTWMSTAKQMVNSFMAMDDEKRRYTYYEKVRVAEAAVFQAIPDRTTIPDLDKGTTCDLMVKIGEALVYRMESYTCAPTVIHVVRILQASKKNPQKYKTATPQLLCSGILRQLEPYCTIGSYGYMLSMLEQIGYMYRFYLTYCISNHANAVKCEKKIDKYKGRYINAIEFLEKRRVWNQADKKFMTPMKQPIKRMQSAPIKRQLSMKTPYTMVAGKHAKCTQRAVHKKKSNRQTRKTRKSSAKTHSTSK